MRHDCLLCEKPRLANDDRDAAEQAATIIVKWSDSEDYDDSQLTRKPS